MRKNRLLCLLVISSMMILCYHQQAYWASLLGYVSIALPVISLIYTILIYRSFAYTQEIDRKFVTKGESVHFELGIYNENYLFYPDVEIQFYGMDSILGKYFEKRRVTVDGSTHNKYKYELLCNYRGYYEVGIEKVYLYDFFGLFKMPYKVLEPKCITVYPRIVPLGFFPIEKCTHQDSEVIVDYCSDQGMILSDTRGYRYGDSMRKVHWKLTAKKQELMVKHTNATVDGKVAIVLDLKKHQGQVDDKALIEDSMVECSIAVMHYCMTCGVPVTLLAQEKELITYPVTSMPTFETAYQFLFKTKFEGDVSVEDVIKCHESLNSRETSVVIITSYLSPQLYEMTYKWGIERREVSIVYVPMLYHRDDEEDEETIDDQVQIMMQSLKEVGVRLFIINPEEDLKIQLEKRE